MMRRSLKKCFFFQGTPGSNNNSSGQTNMTPPVPSESPLTCPPTPTPGKRKKRLSINEYEEGTPNNGQLLLQSDSNMKPNITLSRVDTEDVINFPSKNLNYTPKKHSLQVLKTNVNPYSPEKSVPQQERKFSIPSDSNIPRYLKEYEEKQKLGSGSFGNVMECQNRTDGWLYAVKKNKFKKSK